MTSALRLQGVRSGYGAVEVLHGVDVDVASRGVTALLGRNGAGKSTLLATVAGLVRVRAGTITWAGSDITDWAVTDRADAGLALVPERRGVFRPLTVAENLEVFAKGPQEQARMDDVLAALPALAQRMGQVADSLSGGEQQMLALARPLLQRPSLLLLDELSFGLAPRIVGQLFDLVRDLAATSAVLLVEQFVHDAVRLADVVYVLERGDVAFAGEPGELRLDEAGYGVLGYGV